jgi:predicted dehydrogenase
MKSANSLKINCIGLGHWGPNLVRAIDSNRHAVIGTVCDNNPDRLAVVRQNIPTITNISTDALATINDPECGAIVIATPTETHLSLVRAALEAGKHVFVEKPLSLNVNESVNLVNLAREKKLVLAVGHVFLFNKGVLAIRDLIASGEIGKINYIFATRTNFGPVRTDCNALWDLGSHDLSIINFWIGTNPVSTTARGQAFLNPDIEDLVVASYTYPGSILACIHASWLNPSKIRQIMVVGQKKMVIFDDMNLNAPVQIISKSMNQARFPEYVDSIGTFRMSIPQGEITIPQIKGGEPVANQMAHFIDCIFEQKKPINNADIAVDVVRQLAAAEESMKNQSILTDIKY